jgi:hypothetical protein
VRILGGLWRAVIATAVVLAVNACSGVSNAPTVPDSDPSGTATSAAALRPTGASAPQRPGTVQRTDFDLGTCEATISGGVTASIRSGGDGGATNSEYWFTDAELLEAGRQIGENEASMRAKLDAGEFVFYPLILNCGDGRTGITFLPSATTHKQFPFGPQTYAVSSGQTVPEGAVEAAVEVNGARYRVTDGSFEVRQFDRAVFAGTFHLEIEEQRSTATPKRATVDGRFSMKCTGAPTRGGCEP